MLFLKYKNREKEIFISGVDTSISRIRVCQSYLMDSSNPLSKNRFCITTRIRIAFFEFSLDLDTNNERNIWILQRKEWKEREICSFTFQQCFYNGKLTTFISSPLDSEISIKLSINLHHFSSKKKKKRKKLHSKFTRRYRCDLIECSIETVIYDLSESTLQKNETKNFIVILFDPVSTSNIITIHDTFTLKAVYKDVQIQ